MKAPTADRQEQQLEALRRAKYGTSFSNFAPIFAGMEAKGIPPAEILPRENVFTFNAWKALGRQVRKGEHGVKISTFVPTTKKVQQPDGSETKVNGKLCRSVAVFHISQTDPIGQASASRTPAAIARAEGGAK